MNRAVRSLLLCGIFVVMLMTNVLAAGTINETDTPVAEEISVNAYSAIVLNMDTGKVLYEHNADERNYPASTTKLMTALLCLEHGNMNDVVEASSTAINSVPSTASKGDIYIGERMTVHQVMQLMLVVSASEATTIIAEYVAGDIASFVEMMNEKAAELGCTGTHFVNTHGFPNDEHYTTARDLTKIAMADMKYKEFRDIVGSAVTTVEPTNYHGTQVITSTNGILPGSAYPAYNYPYAIGIKTGHTNSAGYCLVSAADKDGLRLMCVVMGTPSRTASFATTIDLYDWAYDNYDIITYGDKPVPTPELDKDLTAEEDPELEAIDAETAAGKAEADAEASTEESILEAPAETAAETIAEPSAPTLTPVPSLTPVPAEVPATPEKAAPVSQAPTGTQSAVSSFFVFLDKPGSGPVLAIAGIAAAALLILLGVGIGMLLRKK